jgi:hypothetical protein
VPEYAVLGNAALDALATADHPALTGLGPRTRAKYGDELLRIVAAHRPDHYLPPVDRGDAEVLERIEGGERMFGPGAGGAVAKPVFQALVHQLRALRDRGLIDMPERSVACAADEAAGAFLFAGPCCLTEAGREALRDFRRGERRQRERRTEHRRAAKDAPLTVSDTDRRSGGERRRRDRRR